MTSPPPTQTTLIVRTMRDVAGDGDRDRALAIYAAWLDLDLADRIEVSVAGIHYAGAVEARKTEMRRPGLTSDAASLAVRERLSTARRRLFALLTAFDRNRGFGERQTHYGRFWVPVASRPPRVRRPRGLDLLLPGDLLMACQVRAASERDLWLVLDVPDLLWPGLRDYAAEVELSWRTHALLDGRRLDSYPPPEEFAVDVRKPVRTRHAAHSA